MVSTFPTLNGTSDGRDGTWRDGPGWTTEGSRGKTTNFGIQEREDTLSNGSVNKRFPDLTLTVL